MQIRVETPADYPAIADLLLAAFEQGEEARLVEKIRLSDRYIPELALVAEKEGVVVGHILFSYIDLVGAETLPVLGLAPLAVHPQYQRQGIGSALVQAGMAKAEERGEAIAIVLGHPPFYSRFGFEPSVAYGIESPFPVPAEFYMVTFLQPERQGYAGKVIYPSAFAGL
ncbi:N-acetyltransferase [Trichocoleus sp. FACHB-591]|uniref:GNAT family N-acetyltransferase n=1 Tax=Trichocoleus sp. FACHB-591 TaxID=2692872 RepID=UPI001682F1DE|nr:N-acetyltransferase [Trichocoleus sp. FACHB-591]MBD2097088.1 N-acetyltransferase [Trichocoleus sp. FACHB-591]